MKVVSPCTMRDTDKIAMEDYEIPSLVLMENAGREVALAVKNLWAGLGQNKSKKIAFFCGKGNNGGDGFVAARHLENMGFDPVVFIMSNPDHISGDGAVNYKIIKNMGLKIYIIDKLADLNEIVGTVKDAAVLVDALFGTGLKGNVTGIAKELINIINSLAIPIMAVDIPSGICGKTGKVLGTAVKAKQTVTMALPKTGLVIHPGVDYTGELSVAQIGMPVKLIQLVRGKARLLENDWINDCFKKYPSDSHKGTFGKVFVIAGSEGMTGAAALSGLASVKSGAGLVTVGIPKSLNDILEIKLTEAMTLPLAETATRSLSVMALDGALAFAKKCTSVVLGPGLSRNVETQEFVRQFIKKCKVPMVIDADGLNALEKHPKILTGAFAPIIITPHPGEMARLLAQTTSTVNEDRITAVKTAAERFNCIAVLKGARTLIDELNRELLINPTGNAGMGTGGSGDVLSGIIGAFLARGMGAYEAAAAGVYIHGLAGDLAVKVQGEISLTAQDLIDYLPEALRQIKVKNIC